MKKFFIFLALSVFVFSAVQVQATNYRIDVAEVDAMFNEATEYEMKSIMQMDLVSIAGATSSAEHQLSAKKPMTAFLLCTFLGYLGIHRYYLGTKPLVIVGYILTAGGCGIIVTVDWVVLLMGVINDDIRKYVNNDKFFMW